MLQQPSKTWLIPRDRWRRNYYLRGRKSTLSCTDLVIAVTDGPTMKYAETIELVVTAAAGNIVAFTV